jgi:hypothetical protein
MLRRGWQSVATHYYGEAGRALQLAAMARPTKHYNSLLWRGWQRVVACCCGNGQQRYNSQRWPIALQLAAMASSAPTRGAGPTTLQLMAMADSVLQPWPTLRCSKISTLLVGRIVTRKLPRAAPTPTPSGSGNSSTNNSNSNNNSRTYKWQKKSMAFNMKHKKCSFSRIEMYCKEVVKAYVNDGRVVTTVSILKIPVNYGGNSQNKEF